ncbi:MAG: response regulator [Sulfurimonas sp.]|nr:response regulator [Sulfurimonas sp.]MDQ7061610.1 response regulator [Sulfurimonas sp.]
MNIKLVKEVTRDLNILYVEDDKNLLEHTLELLESFFKSVDTAYDGEEGLAKYKAYDKENAQHYDLIITDISMPKMDGLLMCKKILELNYDQSIVITTAHNEVQTLSASLDLGVDGFIKKPMNSEKIMHVLYKVGQAICNSKFVETHIEMIENLNMRLETQNKELSNKNKELEKSFRLLDTMVKKDQFSHVLEDKALEETDAEDQLVGSNIQEQINDLINDDLFELYEIHTEIDLILIDILNTEGSVDATILDKLTNRFTRYSSILSFYNFFDKLSLSMKIFATTIQNNPIPTNEENIRNTFMLLESFIYVLGKWQNDLSAGDATNINSLDASMISDMETIVNMWIQSDEEFVEEDLDDIFDF